MVHRHISDELKEMALSMSLQGLSDSDIRELLESVNDPSSTCEALIAPLGRFHTSPLRLVAHVSSLRWK